MIDILLQTGITHSALERYSSLLLDIFKDTNQAESQSYLGWLQQVTFELEEVPKEWKGFIKSGKDVHPLIYCLETALLSIYELFLYYKLYSKGYFTEDLLMKTPDDYQTQLLKMHGFISTEPHVATAFSWHYKTTNHPLFGDLWLEHQNMISRIKRSSDFTTTESFAELYFDLFPGAVRKLLGEEYTPAEIVGFILDSVGYVVGKGLVDSTLLDPATGMGVFLVEAINRAVSDADNSSNEFLEEFSKKRPICGVEFKMFSAKAAQLNIYLHLFTVLKGLEYSHIDFELPTIVFQGNTLLSEDAVLLGLPMFVKDIASRDYDYVVGNPPYLRIQNIKPESLKSYYERAFQSSEGRFDLSFLFIERGIELLRANGKLGYITTNKFMSSGAGRAIRELISSKTELELLVDLADSEFFKAAVLPCIMVLEKKEPDRKRTFPYAIITKAKKEKAVPAVVPLFDYLRERLSLGLSQELITIKNGKGPITINCKVFHSLQPTDDGETWHFLTPSEEIIINKLSKVANTRLKDISNKIMVGIKTTADDVFIGPMTESFIKETSLEKELLHPIIRGKNVKKWAVSWGPNSPKDRYVLYPHKKVNGRVKAIDLNEYPNAKTYLESKEKELRKRTYVTDAGRDWYEIWVTQDPDNFLKPFKILTPDFSPQNAFALDDKGYYLGGSALAIILGDQSEEFNYYILGVLNSKLLEFFHKFKSSTFIYAGRYRYWSSYMEIYPIFDYRVSDDTERVRICKKIAAISKELSCNATDGDYEDELNDFVYRLFSIEETERKEIEVLLS